MALIALSLMAIAWLTQSLRFIDLIVNRGLGVGTFLYLSSLMLPSLLWIIIPVALFISIVYVYNKLSIDSELIVFQGAGIDKYGIMKPAIYFAILATILSYLISLYLLPASYREFKDMQAFVRDNYASLLLQEGVFANPSKGLTVYIRERENNGMLRGMLVHDNRDENKSITYMAEEGQLVQTSTGPRFLLVNGNRQEIDKKNNELILLYFERYSVELGLFNTGLTQARWREPQERYLGELFFPEDTPDQFLQKLYAEGHNRLIWPIYNMVLALVALAIFATGEFSRHGYARKIFISSISAMAVISWGLSLNNLVAKNHAFTSISYLTVFVLIASILYLIFEDKKLFTRAWWMEKLRHIKSSV